jgi:putative peptidoglycan lipid II flippase
VNADEPARDADAGHRSIRSTWMISALTLASRGLGFFRLILLVQLFASMRWVSDALIFAFRIPNLFRNLLGEGALSAAFIPVFVRENEREGRASASELASQVFSLLALGSALIAVVGAFVCLVLDAVFGLTEELTLALRLTAFLLPFMPLVCLAALLGGMLQGLRRFALPAALSIILNLGFIAGFGYVYFIRAGGNLAGLSPGDAYVVAVFVLLAGLVEVAVQLPALKALGIRLRPALTLTHSGLKTIFAAFIPAALGLGLVQINAFVDSLIAGSLSLSSPGAMTYLEIGVRYMQLPLGVFGVAIATAAFPEFASAAGKGDDKQLLGHLVRAVRMSLFLILPASAVLIAMADPIIRLTCQRPDLAFDHAAVYRSSLVMILYCAGLIFYSFRQILVRVFYAKGDYSYPVKAAVVMVFVNLALNLTLINVRDPFLRHFPEYLRYWNIDPSAFPRDMRLNEAGLALATMLTAVADVAVLLLGAYSRLGKAFRGDFDPKRLTELGHTALRMAGASIALGILVYLYRNSIPYEPGFLRLLERVLVPCVLAAGTFSIIGSVLPLPEMREFLYPLFRRRKSRPSETDAGTSEK